MPKTLVTKDNVFDILQKTERAWARKYLAMYSSLWGGITKDPDLMCIPADDHLVHRGDGVFDAMRCINGSIYLLERHLLRLKRSAEAIQLGIPIEMEELRRLVIEVARAGGEANSILRITISRGPGGFSTNPYECKGPQIYINAIKYDPPPARYYENGVSLLTSKLPQKDPFFANIKSCNYLLNVLMKKEALDNGVDYTVGLDEKGFLTEGSTENIAIFGKDGYFSIPPFDTVLMGTTAVRVKELAQELVKKNIIKGVNEKKITREEAYQAREIFLTGTSINILPVTLYDGVKISNGRPGDLFKTLNQMLLKDMAQNKELLTPV